MIIDVGSLIEVEIGNGIELGIDVGSLLTRNGRVAVEIEAESLRRTQKSNSRHVSERPKSRTDLASAWIGTPKIEIEIAIGVN